MAKLTLKIFILFLGITSLAEADVTKTFTCTSKSNYYHTACTPNPYKGDWSQPEDIVSILSVRQLSSVSCAGKYKIGFRQLQVEVWGGCSAEFTVSLKYSMPAAGLEIYGTYAYLNIWGAMPYTNLYYYSTTDGIVRSLGRTDYKGHYSNSWDTSPWPKGNYFIYIYGTDLNGVYGQIGRDYLSVN